MRIGLFFIATLIFLASESNAQPVKTTIRFKQPDIRAKLSNPNVQTIYQGSQGFIWIGTDDGLNRFDGYTYKIYRNIPGDSTSLIKNRIQCVFEDSRGTMWVSTIIQGLHQYDRRSDTFRRIPEFSQQGTQIMEIIEDKVGNIWLGGIDNNQTFIAKIDRVTGTIQRHHLLPNNDHVYTMIQVSNDELWLGTRINGLYSWNIETEQLVEIGRNELLSVDIEKLLADDRGNIWIATRGGLSKYSLTSGKYQNYIASPGQNGLPIDDLLDLCIENDNLWIGTENGGLSQFDLKTETFTNYLYDKFDPYSIVNNSIWALYTDRANRVWVGSYAKGICVYDRLDSKFQTLQMPIQSDLLNAYIEDSKGRAWVGTEDGVLLIDGGNSTQFRYEPKSKKGLSNKAVNCIFEDSQHQIWLGLWNGGLNRYNEKTKSFDFFLPDPQRPNSLGNPNVFSIFEYSETKELMVCTFGGLYILKDDRAGGIFESAVDMSVEGNQLMLTGLEDSKKNIWIGSYTGISRFHRDTHTFEKYYLKPDSSESNDRVNCIFEDSKQRLWVGSSEGLHLKLDHGKFMTFSEADGLPVNYVVGILEDIHGNLWLGTTNGLTWFNPETKVFKTYNEGDGLSTSEFRRKAFFEADNGNLYFGGRGLNVFHPDSLSANLAPPEVFLTELRVFNQPITLGGEDGILLHSIKETDAIQLDFRDTFFSIHYVGINFTSSYKNQYAYMLEGFDNQWNYVGDQRFATFTNLDPGTYYFKVKASNNDGVWNEKGATLKIIINPPIWRTWWFRTSGVLLISVLIIGFYFYRIRSIKAINLRLEQQVNERTQELKSRNAELAKSEEAISHQNDALIQKSNEVAYQRDLLAEQNRQLGDAKIIIEQKSGEILMQNQILEKEVDRRTNELVSQNIQLQQFAFITAHNLRAPVARILGLGQLLKYPSSPEEEKEILSKIINNTFELDEVVKDLNKILDIQYNTAKIWNNVDLGQELDNVLNSLRREIVETGTKVDADFSACGSIHSVKSYMNSILLNLISNAIKYRHPQRKPLISITSDLSHSYLILTVMDNGVGIDMAKHGENLFKLYKRFHTHVDGKGMGLYMVKTQVEALGGTIKVTGEPEVGLVFTIKLPITRTDVNAAEV